jgi:iron complex outermembrane receptor protein
MYLHRRPARQQVRFALAPFALAARQLLGAGLTVAVAGVAAQTVEAPAASPAAPTTPVNRALAPVTVYGSADSIGGLQKTYSGGQLARGGSLGLFGINDLMNVPFSTTNYTSELIQNQQARTVADVVLNDASVRTLTARGGFGDDFQIRGFQVGNGDMSLNNLFGIAPSTNIPVEYIERVEVLKGPGALANGVGPNGSIGGSINLVTKRAADIPLTRLTTTFMSKGQLGAHLDVGRRFGEDNQWGVRVNAVARGGEGNIDGGKQNMGLGAVGLDYAGARLRWSMDVVASEGDLREFRPQIGFAAGTTAIPAVPDPRGNFYPGQRLRDHLRTVMTRVEYDLDDTTMIYAGFGKTSHNYQQNLASGRPDASGNFMVRNAWYDQDQRGKAADLGLRTRFTTGSVGHTLVLGANYLDQYTSYFYAQSATEVPSNLYDPAPLPPILVPRDAPERSGEIRQNSFAVADTMSFFNERFLVTLGARHQSLAQESFRAPPPNTYVSYESSRTTPLVGLVFKPMKNVSIYANHTAGLTRGGVAGPTTANAGQTFAPQLSKQNEVGVKVDWGQLTTQAAVYEIKRPGSFIDPATNMFSFGGEQRNRGLEFTAYGEIQRGLRVLASAAFQQGKLTRTAGGVNDGKKAVGVPERTFNFGLDWDTPFVPGLSLNGRVIHTGSVFTDAGNTLPVDGWTRLDLGARYAMKVAGRPVMLRAALENVTNERYWVVSNYATVGAPRTLQLSASMDF